MMVFKVDFFCNNEFHKATIGGHSYWDAKRRFFLPIARVYKDLKIIKIKEV